MKEVKKAKKTNEKDTSFSILLTSFISAVICCICLVTTTYAWFTANISVTSSAMKGAKFAVSVFCPDLPIGTGTKDQTTEIMPDEEDEETLKEMTADNEGSYILTSGITYTVKNVGTAKNGYCILNINNGDKYLAVFNENTEEYTFTITITGDSTTTSATMKIEACNLGSYSGIDSTVTGFNSGTTNAITITVPALDPDETENVFAKQNSMELWDDEEETEATASPTPTSTPDTTASPETTSDPTSIPEQFTVSDLVEQYKTAYAANDETTMADIQSKVDSYLTEEDKATFTATIEAYITEQTADVVTETTATPEPTVTTETVEATVEPTTTTETVINENNEGNE